MLTEFSIGNYQAFSSPQRVPLKPITLIFGPNSAGKSALLRSLLVARHAILNGRLSKSEGAGERHPGAYADIVRNGYSNPISFGFLVRPEGNSPEETLEINLAWKEAASGSLETESFILRRSQSDFAAYSAVLSSRNLQIGSVGDELRQHMIGARAASDTEGRLDDMIHRTIKKRICLKKDLAIPGSDADQFRIDDDKVDEPDLLNFLEESQNEGVSNDKLIASIQRIKATVDKLKSALITHIKAVDTSLRNDLLNLIYHGPIRPICDEITKARQAEPGIKEWWNLAADPKLRTKVNDWLASDIFKTKYRLEFDRLFPDSSLQDLLRSLSKEYDIQKLVKAAFQAKFDTDLAFRESEIDKAAPDTELWLEDAYEDQDERAAAARSLASDNIYEEAAIRGGQHYNSLLEEFDFYSAELFLIEGVNQIMNDLRGQVESVRGHDTAMFGGFDSAKVRFCSSDSSKQVSPSNMGIGFSQMMPIVASCFGSENTLIAIEQPELHVHPALQTELADLFIQSAKERGNRFLIETHSEHLILRVMRRIRETARNSLPEGKPAICPDDVAVLYVQPGENGSTVQELRIDEQGRFVDNWPQGFFEERLDEMF
jgi:predicted ATPase